MENTAGQATAKRKSTPTVPFFKVRKCCRDGAIAQMRSYTGGDAAKLEPEMVKTAFKSQVGANGSNIIGVPTVESVTFGEVSGHLVFIPIKGSDLPAFTSLEQLRSMF